jgi:hypothetical protein
MPPQSKNFKNAGKLGFARLFRAYFLALSVYPLADW